MTAGTVIAGRYELGGRLGVGGMSTVQEAFDRRLERHVAVKLLAEHLAEDPQFVSRFRREALSAARLVHPNVVQVFDFGLDETSGRHYIVMELIRGQSGAEILRERGRLPVDEALALVGGACRGLDYAHKNGVVHRDVKPGNVMRSDEGQIKLADFGIAKAVHEDSNITQVGSVLGTASYLAPEQARGEEAGPAADLYALGVVTYQLLSGRLPYEARSLTELALKQQQEAPAYLHDLDPAIPEALSHAVDRALSLDAGERHGDADTMRHALVAGAKGVMTDPPTTAARAMGADPTSATRAIPASQITADQPAISARAPRAPRPAPPGHGPAGAAVAAAAAPAPAPRRKKRRARRFFLVLLALIVVLGGGLAAIIATSSDPQTIRLREITEDEVGGMIRELTQLIEDNTN